MISRDELFELIKDHQKPSVTLFAGMYVSGPETRQNAIRFRNLLGQAKQHLEQAGFGEHSSMLEPLSQWENDEHLWQHQDKGLAVFISPSSIRRFQVPLELQDEVYVGERFEVRPLLPLFRGEGEFFVLCLNQKDVRLYEATKFSINEVELEDVPTRLDEALWYDDQEKSLQQHTRSQQFSGPSTGAGRAPMYFGQGRPDDGRKNQIKRFFQKLDAGLHRYLNGSNKPLVIAGVDMYHAIYQEANSYQHLADQGLRLNPETLSTDELRTRAWECVKDRLLRDEEEQLQRYYSMAGTGKASGDLEEIVREAQHGRVAALFLPDGPSVWGEFDRGTGEVETVEERTNGSEDLLNLAAINTIANGGEVYFLNKDKMPEATRAAAVFRY